MSDVPKPLIPVLGKTVIEHCVESLGLSGQFVFVTRKFSEFPNSDSLDRQLEEILRKLQPSCKIINVDYVTEGAASSVLLATDLIDNNSPLVVTNCDQRVNWDATKFVFHVGSTDCDGCVTTYPHPGIILNQKSPYSFVELNEQGLAVRFEEKFAISPSALNGIHYWKHGSSFVSSARAMVEANDRVNNEFYVSRSFNWLLKDTSKTVTAFPMLKHEFHALGNPEEIRSYSETAQLG